MKVHSKTEELRIKYNEDDSKAAKTWTCNSTVKTGLVGSLRDGIFRTQEMRKRKG